MESKIIFYVAPLKHPFLHVVRVGLKKQPRFLSVPQSLFMFWTTVLLAATYAMLTRAGACPGQPNAFPVWTGPPRFHMRIPNGEHYVAGNGTDTFNVLHLYGSYYDMGVAQGRLFASVIPTGINRLYDWIEQQVEQSVPWIPAWIAAIIADFGAPLAFEITFNQTKAFIPQKYLDEMKGIADGAGVPHQDIYNVNMIPETIKAQCSVIGANKAATANSPGVNGGLIHLRTLDGMGGYSMPIKDLATVAVYHPDNATGEATHANFAWISFVGTVTGFGDFVGVGEKFWDGQNETIESTAGEPWMFVTRDMLTKRSLSDAMNHLKNAKRTCAVRLGIGGRLENKFYGAQVAAKAYELFNSSTDNDPPNHPAIKDIVYWDKHSQPSPSDCFPTLFKQYYGNISAERLALDVAPVAKTGDLHAAIFDYPNQIAFFSNARKTFATDGPLKAYDRQFTRLDMRKLFAKTYGVE